MKKNKFLKVFGVGLACLALTSNVFASTVTITPEQQAIIDSLNELRVTETDTTERSLHSLRSSSRSDSKRIRGYRGSVLLWFADYIDWTYDGTYISNVSAWQESGFTFPNTAKKGGIKKISGSENKTSEWRAEKTSGIGSITPWGDVNIYQQDITDYYTINGDGTYTSTAQETTTE